MTLRLRCKMILITMKHRFIFLSALLLAPLVALHAAVPEKLLPLPGQVFEVEGRTAFVILPSTKTTNQLVPWVWYAPTLPGLPGKEEQWMFDQFLDAGITISLLALSRTPGGIPMPFAP